MRDDMTQKIYLASSWRNPYQPAVLERLRQQWEVYDFRNPAPGNEGFHWSEIHPEWRRWDVIEFCDALKHPIAERGFRYDMDALQWCDTCVLLLPAGRSASLELGYCAGAGKRTAVLVMEQMEPELMLKMADFITDDIERLCSWLATPTSARVRELERQVEKWRSLAHKAWVELELIDPNNDVTEELFRALAEAAAITERSKS